jgi:hypothetical protein
MIAERFRRHRQMLDTYDAVDAARRLRQDRQGR